LRSFGRSREREREKERERERDMERESKRERKRERERERDLLARKAVTVVICLFDWNDGTAIGQKGPKLLARKKKKKKKKKRDVFVDAAKENGGRGEGGSILAG
jgi:hypothetical protein